MSVISWSKSECKDSYLHRYRIIGQDSRAVMEICEICRDVQVFKLFKGNPDKQTYLASHLRSALPVFHRLYPREYSKKNV